jgi:hypothetical protein
MIADYMDSTVFPTCVPAASNQPIHFCIRRVELDFKLGEGWDWGRGEMGEQAVGKACNYNAV